MTPEERKLKIEELSAHLHAINEAIAELGEASHQAHGASAISEPDDVVDDPAMAELLAQRDLVQERLRHLLKDE